MNKILVTEHFLSWYNAECCLSDEFGNDLDCDECIEVYDGKDGNVVQTIPLGDAKEIYDEYYCNGMDYATQWDIVSFDTESEEYRKWQNGLDNVLKQQEALLPELLKKLREIIPPTIEVDVLKVD